MHHPTKKTSSFKPAFFDHILQPCTATCPPLSDTWCGLESTKKRASKLCNLPDLNSWSVPHSQSGCPFLIRSSSGHPFITNQVIPNLLVGDELTTNIAFLESEIRRLGSDSIVCVLSTTSCFAARAIDRSATRLSPRLSPLPSLIIFLMTCQ